MAPFLIFTMVLTAVVSVFVLASNHQRPANRFFSLTAVLVIGTLFCIYKAISIDESGGGALDPIPWLRANGALNAFIPAALRLLRESLLTPGSTSRALFFRCLPWLLYGAFLTTLATTEWYIPFDSTPEARKRGVAYWFLSLSIIVVHILFIIETWRAMERVNGIRRLELQFLVFNLGIGSLLCVCLAATGNFFQITMLKQASLIAAAAAFVFTAWAVCFHKIFDARHAASLLTHRFIVISIGASFGLFIAYVLKLLMPALVALPLAFGAGYLLATAVDAKSLTFFGLNTENVLSRMRQAVVDIARTEPHLSGLIGRFEAFLAQTSGGSFAAFVRNDGDGIFLAGKPFRISPLADIALCELSWATPEGLLRRRSNPAIDELGILLNAHSLGLLVAIPQGSPTPSLIVALGTKTNEWPFTYPEVQRIQNIAELMDNILTRARLTEQAALQAKMEHLAMMSRGLAHDLKNLITPVSSFLVHTDRSFEPDSPAAEVHAAAQRSVRIMTDYVREARFFSEQLAPNFESVDLVRVFDAVEEITAQHAQRRGVALLRRVDFASPFSADGVLLQRMLANFVANAIDASAAGKSVVLAATASRRLDWLQLQVSDEGSGISREHLGRIFEPYFTTKEFGDDVRGFGLGLTIAQKIADLHRGLVSVESGLGKGTTFTIEIPVAQPVPASPAPLVASHTPGQSRSHFQAAGA